MAGVDVDESRQSGTDDWMASVRSVTDGAVLHVLSNVVMNGVAFLLTLLVTNALGATLYGFYTYARRIAREMQKFTNLGTDIAVTRLISGNLDDRAYRNGVVSLSYLTTFLVSAVATVALFVLAPTIDAYTFQDPEFVTALRAFVVAVPFIALTKIGTNSFRGLEMPIHQNALKIVVSVVRLVAVGGAVLLGYSLFGASVAFALAAAFGFVLVTAAVLARTDLRPSWGLSRSDVTAFYNYSVPLSGSKAGTLLYNQTDVFMVGIFLSSTEVGIYSVSMLLAGVILMPLSGFNQLFPPVVSRLHSEDNTEMLQSIFAAVTRWAITATLFIALVLIIYRRPILELFGPEFTAGTTVLTLFVVGQSIVAFVGPSNDLLTMTDHQYVVMVNHWAFGVANVILNYYLIQEIGLIGAAVATATVLACLNVVRLAEVWYLEDVVPYTRRLWKPFVATVVAAAVMLAASALVSDLLLLIAGTASGALVYGVVIYLLGIEPRDKRLLRNYYDLVD